MIGGTRRWRAKMVERTPNRWNAAGRAQSGVSLAQLGWEETERLRAGRECGLVIAYAFCAFATLDPCCKASFSAERIVRRNRACVK